MNLETESVRSMMANAHGIADAVTATPSNDGKMILAAMLGACANVCDRLENIGRQLDRLMPVDPVAAPEINTNGA